jgi:putative hydrolase of the HAD superfamily
MIDLDNTLVDRDAAFRAAAIDFLTEHGLPEGDLDWLMTLDASGHTPRREVARALSERYGGIDARDFLDRGRPTGSPCPTRSARRSSRPAPRAGPA